MSCRLKDKKGKGKEKAVGGGQFETGKWHDAAHAPRTDGWDFEDQPAKLGSSGSAKDVGASGLTPQRDDMSHLDPARQQEMLDQIRPCGEVDLPCSVGNDLSDPVGGNDWGCSGGDDFSSPAGCDDLGDVL
jgi:hypothetical protein